MVMLMLLVRNPKVMGQLVVRGWLYVLGWASTVAMAFCIVGMLVSFFCLEIRRRGRTTSDRELEAVAALAREGTKVPARKLWNQD
jgi:hypothetical protein